MKKKKRRQSRQKRRVARAQARVAKNPGVSSLLLVNPSHRPAPALNPASVSKVVQSAVRTALKEKEKKMPKKARRKKRAGRPKRASHSAPHRPAAQPAVQIINHGGATGKTSLKPVVKRGGTTLPLDLDKRYRGYKPRKGPHRGKNQKRGLKALERDRKSILWNLSRGTPSAQQWVLKNVPKLNPFSRAEAKGTATEIGVGVASFLGSRIISNGIARIPFLARFGTHASVAASILVAVGSYFAGKKWPHLKKPLMYGTALAAIDALVKNYVTPHLPPAAAGILGDLPPHDGMAGYLPAHDPMGDLGCGPGYAGMGMEADEAMADLEGLGLDVHEAMADAGDGIGGMGIDVHEALADGDMSGMGIDVHEALADGDYGTGAYVPSMNGYVPTGTGAYLPSQGMGADAKDAAAMIFGGPEALMHYKLLQRRRRQRALARRRAWLLRQHSMYPPNGPAPFVPPPNGSERHFLPPPYGDTRRFMPPPHHGGSVRVPAQCDFYLPSGTTVAAPPARTLPSGADSGKAHSMMGVPGGIFAE